MPRFSGIYTLPSAIFSNVLCIFTASGSFFATPSASLGLTVDKLSICLAAQAPHYVFVNGLSIFKNYPPVTPGIIKPKEANAILP